MRNNQRYEDEHPSTLLYKLIPAIIFLSAAALGLYLCFAVPVIDTPLYKMREILIHIGGEICPLAALFFAWFGVLFLRACRGKRDKFIFIVSGTAAFLTVFAGVHLFSAESITANLNLHYYANFVAASYERGIGGGLLGAILSYPLYNYLGLALSVAACAALFILCLTGMGITGRLLGAMQTGADEKRNRRIRERQNAERVRADEEARRREAQQRRREDAELRRREAEERRRREEEEARRREAQERPPRRNAPRRRTVEPEEPAPRPRRTNKSDDNSLSGESTKPAKLRRVSDPDRDSVKLPNRKPPVTTHKKPEVAPESSILDILPEDEVPESLRRTKKTKETPPPDDLFTVEVDAEEPAGEAFTPVNYEVPKAKKTPVVEGVRSLDLSEGKPEKKKSEPAPAVEKKKPERRGLFSRLSEPDEDDDAYNYPPIDLLAEGDSAQDVRVHKDADERKAQELIEALHSFGIDMKLVGIAHGPAVTRFELQPPPGVKVSRITSLSDDIALHLAAETVRIEAPIPGKAAVGVEIPNEKRESVHLRDVLESSEAIRNPSRLAVGLGKDNAGRFIIADIAKMPHVLIAGQTGSGKSVCVNSIICSILMRATPDEVRMILIDPKVVELSVYNGIPHLIAPVVTDPKKAASALDWAVAEMSRRYNAFAERGVRDIKGYNKALEKDEKPMPQMIIIIDELADLMMVAAKNVEDSICRLAQLARAAGMHLVIATQRPSVNVVTGIIKANIPSRIAFAVSSITDSRVMLDYGGAEKLLGNGDMLFVPPATSKSVRVQGSWISDEEVHAIVQFIQSRCDANYDEDVIEKIETAAMSDGDREDHEQEERNGKIDSKLREAIEIVVEAGQASVSMLQRRMRVGYARAGRLIDEMEQRGIVSFADGSKPRNVLIDREQMLRLFEDDD